MANLHRKRGHPQQAIDSLAELYLSFPGNQAIALEYGKALLESARPRGSRDCQQGIETTTRRTARMTLSFMRLYAQAANLAGDEVRSIEAIAESYYQRGGTEEAITQLESLEKRSDLDYYQRARVSARLMELRIEAGETDKPKGSLTIGARCRQVYVMRPA